MLRLPVALPAACALLALTCGPAHAGRVVATGHAWDDTCSAPEGPAGCTGLRAATDWVRAGAPDPRKPVLVLQSATGTLQTALRAAYPAEPGPPSMQVLDPAAAYVAQTPIDTTAYSAVLVAGLTEIAPGVRANVEQFFDRGGGVLLVGAGSDLVLPLGLPKRTPTGATTLTAAGRAIGLIEDDVTAGGLNHAWAAPAANAPLRTAERDEAGAAGTLVGEGVVVDGAIADTPIELPGGGSAGTAGTTGAAGEDGAGGAASCSSRRQLTLHVHQLPGVVYRRVVVKVTGRPRQVLDGADVGATIDLRGLPKGRYVVRIQVETQDGRKLRGTRAYRTCDPARRPGRRHPL